jgi:hypothetical protein
MSLSATTVYSVDNNCLDHMKKGKYQGQCMDTEFKRAVHIFGESGQQVSFENFRKDGRFYKAEIPLDQIASMSYVIVDLNAKPVNYLSLINISHTQLRFKLKPGAFARLTSEKDGRTQNENDFLISFNFMAPKGVKYDPLKGFNEDLYGSVVQIFSTQDEIKNRFGTNKLNMYEVRLNVTTPEAARVLRKALELSEQGQYSVPYDTWSSNCTTYLYDIMDAGLGLQNEPYRFKPWMARDTGMIPGLLALEERGLVADTTKVELLNREFGAPQFPSGSNRYFNSWTGKTWKQIKERFPAPSGANHH